jgi:hypothetical protein
MAGIHEMPCSLNTKKDDIFYLLLQRLNIDPRLKPSLLEVGCSNGYKIEWFEALGFVSYSIDPSKLAIKDGVNLGRKLSVSTADNLPYENECFDIVVLKFCLFLCDRNDLFRNVYEVDRVLKKNSNIISHDFFNKGHKINDYHHKNGAKSYKIDNSIIFSLHPYFDVFYHDVSVCHEIGRPFTEEEDKFVSVTE